MKLSADLTRALERIADWQRAQRDGTDPTSRLFSADREKAPAVPDALLYRREERRVLAEDARAGRIERLRRGVYMLPHAPTGLTAPDRETRALRRVRGVVEASGTNLCFSHTTAALLHGCWLFDVPDTVHVTYAGKPHIARAKADDVRKHWSRLDRRYRTAVGQVPVTTLERTAVDCARLLRFDSGVVLVTSAFRLGADPVVVGEILRTSGGARGIVTARAVVEAVDPGCASPGEVLVHQAARRLRPQGLATQIPVTTRRGVCWVDAGWTDLRIGFEFSGAVKFSGGEFGDPDTRRTEQSARTQSLTEAGWWIVDLSWTDVLDQEALDVTLRQSLVDRRRHPAGPPR
ncbi:hypothetical protein [Promicromonospora sp. MEB111]|uniref:type IV toxin-antitoxin system AbiEi family antitoxin domain-containing protein n=1 Tax=Promicromonospora sp. MEB111 TaxID=3040301 RepID=UPI00254DB010|nr:hypothetical protein [Promicromonospora sp. MEB111]